MSFELRDGKPVIVMNSQDPRLQLNHFVEDSFGMILNLEERNSWLEWEKDEQSRLRNV